MTNPGPNLLSKKEMNIGDCVRWTLISHLCDSNTSKSVNFTAKLEGVLDLHLIFKF